MNSLTGCLALLALIAFHAGCASRPTTTQAQNQARSARTSPSSAPAPSTAATPTQAKIEGAFGKNLGEVFAPSSAIATNVLPDESFYHFAPSQPFQTFKRYYLMITPKTKRIHTIRAEGPQEPATFNLLKAALTQKYGPSQWGPYNEYHKVEGRRGVQGRCNLKLDGGGSWVRVEYTDYALADLAQRELRELKLEKADKSGL